MNKEFLSGTSLAAYLVMSATPLNPFITILPLAIAGLLLATGSSHRWLEAYPDLNKTAVFYVIAFCCSFGLSTLYSTDPARSLQTTILLFPGILILFIYRGLMPPALRELILYRGVAVMIIVASVLVIAAYMIVGHNDPLVPFRLIGSPSLVVPNDMLLCVTLLPLVIFGFGLEQTTGRKLLPVLAIVLCLAAVLLVRSRLCLFSLLLIFSIYCYIRNPRYLIPGIFSLAALILVVDQSFELGITHKFTEFWLRNQRLGIWYIGLSAYGDQAITGVGPAQFETMYRSTVDTIQLPGWMRVDNWMVPWAHNIYLEALLERGIIGFATLVLLLWHMLLVLFRRLRPEQGTYRPFDLAMFVAFMVFLFAGFFELTMQRNWVVTALFLMIAVYLVPTPRNAGPQNCGAKAPVGIPGRRARRFLWLTAPAVVVFSLLVLTAKIDKDRVHADVTSYCRSLASSAKNTAPELIQLRMGKCSRAFEQTIAEDPLGFFEKAGNSALSAKWRYLWWQLDFW